MFFFLTTRIAVRFENNYITKIHFWRTFSNSWSAKFEFSTRSPVSQVLGRRLYFGKLCKMRTRLYRVHIVYVRTKCKHKRAVNYGLGGQGRTGRVPPLTTRRRPSRADDRLLFSTLLFHARQKTKLLRCGRVAEKLLKDHTRSSLSENSMFI